MLKRTRDLLKTIDEVEHADGDESVNLDDLIALQTEAVEQSRSLRSWRKRE